MECVDQGRYGSLECYRMEMRRESWGGITSAELIPEDDDDETPIAPDEASGLRSLNLMQLGRDQVPILRRNCWHP